MSKRRPIRRALVVDDDQAVQTIALLSLVEVGEWETLLASTGESAIDIARRKQPDVILLDVMLPGLSGLETLAQLRAHPDTESIPVVFSTACTREADVDAYARAGAAGVIAKPFDPNRLPSLITEILHGHAQPPAARSGVFDRVAIRFGVSLPDRVGRLGELIQKARREPAALESLRSDLHRLHGTAGSYGFSDISEIAGELELAVLAPRVDWGQVAALWRDLDAEARRV
ncbi:MAG: response regulator [Myxococcales bacterium FL481]|nr:MAG: response regulator [Myxococcales bacterium FL481]